MCVCLLKYCAWHDKWYYKMWLSYKLIFIDKAQWCHKIVCPCSSCTLRHVVGQAVFGIWSKIDIPSAMSKRCNSLVLSDSEHRLQILQQLRTMLMSLTTRCPTTWRLQHWSLIVIANDVIVTLCIANTLYLKANLMFNVYVCLSLQNLRQSTRRSLGPWLNRDSYGQIRILVAARHFLQSLGLFCGNAHTYVAP